MSYVISWKIRPRYNGTWLYLGVNFVREEVTPKGESIHFSLFHGTPLHWGRYKIADISQTTFSNAFSWMKMYEFILRFHWSLFLRLYWTGCPWFKSYITIKLQAYCNWRLIRYNMPSFAMLALSNNIIVDSSQNCFRIDGLTIYLNRIINTNM